MTRPARGRRDARSLSSQGRCAGWRPACRDALLIGICQLEERGLAPLGSEKLEAHGNAERSRRGWCREPPRKCDGREPRTVRKDAIPLDLFLADRHDQPPLMRI